MTRLAPIPTAGEIVAVNAVAAPFPPVTAAAVPSGWTSPAGVVPELVVDLSAAGDAVITNVLLYAAFEHTQADPVPDTTFTAATTDICTDASHGLLTGEGPVRVSSSGTLPAGLSADVDYWIIYLSVNTYSLASSRANAFAGTAVDITSVGAGTHTLADTSSTKLIKWRRLGVIASAPTLSFREGVAVEVECEPRAVAYGVVWTGTAGTAVRAAVIARVPS